MSVHQDSIFLPAAAMVLLTAMVWVRMYVDRIGEMRAKRISPQKLSSSQAARELLQRANAADNFRNLFEVPVLFYALCAALAVSHQVTPLFVTGGWLYVVLRAGHSFIHITYNRVMHRFSAYVASTVLLFALWAMFTVRLLMA